MRTAHTPLHAVTRLNSFLLVGVLIIVAAVLAAPVYSVHSSSLPISSAPATVPSGPPAKASQLNLLPVSNNLARWSSPTFRSFLPVPSFQETIETFAADCVTPQSSFLLGETVCAKTDDVDLGFPGGRWVNWMRQDLSIAHGSSTTTLITANPQFFAFVPDQTGTWKATIAESGNDSQTPAVFTVGLASESIATYEATCILAQDNFTLNPTSVTVCAKADPNFTGSRFIHWVDSQGGAFQSDVVTSGNASSMSTITVAGNYWLYFSDEDGNLRSSHRFTVSDPAQPQVDLAIFKTKGPEDVIAGGFISFVVTVSNRGPDTASTVSIADAIPANTTFSSGSQDSGPTFACNGDFSTCSIPSLPAGDSATFTLIYQVGGAAVGTEISNTATVTSTTSEIHTPDNSATATGTVVSGTPAGDCTLDCPNDIVTSATTHGVGGGANVTFGAAEGFGDCGTITSNPTSGFFFPIGTTTVINSSSTGGGGCSFTVTVVDTDAPTITCPTNISVTANSGQGSAFVPNPNGSSSSVGSPTTTGDQPMEVTGSREDGESLTAAYPLGTTDITWIATDPSGRQATCTQTITVFANQVLTITCPANVTANSPTGCDPATVNPGQPTSNSGTATIIGRRSDNLAYSNTAEFNDPYPIGTTTIEWIATDTDTQSASCTQTVTVTGTDTTPPTLNVPPNISVTTSTCSATLDDELGVATAEDDCGTVNISRSGVPTFTCPTPQNPNQQCESFVFPTGTTIITYTATNASGLTTTGTQTVTVTESPAIPPTITAPADASYQCASEVPAANASEATASDNCGTPVVAVSQTSNGGAGTAASPLVLTRTYTATDGSGNSSSDSQTITVVDDTPPTISCPADMTVYLPLNSTATSTVVTYTAPTGSDNCGTATTTQTGGLASGASFPVGTTTNIFTVTDGAGLSASCQFTVTVLYNFTGFFSPINNLPTLNTVNAGRNIPVKFSLSGDKGLNIFAPDNPYSVSYNCDTNDPGVDITETNSPGGSVLTYSPDTYHYSWKTESSWAGTCRTLVVTLNDGSVHTANFKFK